jgi:hypothetical protein
LDEPNWPDTPTLLDKPAVDFDIVWGVATQDLPSLINALRKLAPPE